MVLQGQWQLFDIAVASRNEGYKVCLDGETVTENDLLKHLNNKGLVERDHVTKKDTFYLYKAEWSSQTFTHICQKNYTRNNQRTIKCYSNDTGSLTLYVNNVEIETLPISNHIVVFTARNYSLNDVVTVTGSDSSDTFTFTQVADNAVV